MAPEEDGFSIVEVIIAMFLLAALSLAVLPLIIRATVVSVENEDSVSAIAAANAQIAAVRAQFPNDPAATRTCATLQTVVADLEDDASYPGLVVDFASVSCSGVVGAAAVTVKVAVDSVGTSSRVELATRVLVSGP